MPAWVTYVISGAAVLTAVGVVWVKAFRPVLEGYHEWRGIQEQMLPLLRDLTSVFRDTPHAFEVLDQIIAQFRTDSGSSARDLMNRLEESAVANQQAVQLLQVGMRAQEKLAEIDRASIQRLILLLDRLTIQTTDMQSAQKGVASDLSVAQKAVDGVADDLAASHRRASDVPVTGDPGAAATAASRHPEE